MWWLLFLAVWAPLGYGGLRLWRELMVGTRDPKHGCTGKQEIADDFKEWTDSISEDLMAVLIWVLKVVVYTFVWLLVRGVGLLILGPLALLGWVVIVGTVTVLGRIR